ncbi:MAG: thiolase family protein [Sphingobacterium sp.]|uniref:thiolase family protein n=1 Tax=Sphingobacterium sp. JB170 TaxID=1434842 RepID=UPI00097EAD80|nr:thiolase family protein [Sphingobacterium sp. JB170]SJN38746.1 Acetyl-CoA acetyltransferase [Sphingobacterium sp. JB170]
MIKRVFIVAAKRTAIGSFGGKLSALSATQLGGHAVAGLLNGTGLPAAEIQEVLMGCALQAGMGQAPARQVVRYAGLADHTSATTINKVCSSGMKAVTMACQSILLDDVHISIAGGMESMSQVPYYVPSLRWGAKYGAQSLLDGVQHDGLVDVYSEQAMGNYGDLCAQRYEISRTSQDDYAISSYQRAQQTWAEGKFCSEVIPVPVKLRSGEMLVEQDEAYLKVDFEKLRGLKAAFSSDGTVTAGNASSLSDGAAALLLMSEDRARSLKMKPLAEIVAYTDVEQAPEWFTTSPSIATEKVLEKAGLQLNDIDYFEFNEAFSVVPLVNAQILSIPRDKINIYGGAVSLGHPLGCSGARILVTLTNILRQEGGRYGLAAICNGGGGASAMIIKRVED